MGGRKFDVRAALHAPLHAVFLERPHERKLDVRAALHALLHDPLFVSCPSWTLLSRMRFMHVLQHITVGACRAVFLERSHGGYSFEVIADARKPLAELKASSW